MEYETLLLEVGGPVATITLNRPEIDNMLSDQLLLELMDALGELGADAALRAVIITGAGSAFVGAADVAQLVDMTPPRALAMAQLGQGVCDAIEGLGVPVIAAVNGVALGGGCELVMACDLVYASEGAAFGQIEVGGGVMPGFGGTWRLQRRVGPARAAEMIFTGQPIPAQKAQEVGLVLEVLPANQLMDHCRSVADQITANAPLAVQRAKSAIIAAASLPLQSSNALERRAFSTLFGTEDQRQRMAAFLREHAAS